MIGRWRRFVAWLGDTRTFLARRPGAMAAVGVSLAAGLAGGWLPAEGAFDYVWRDPTFCDDCHVHDYADEAYFRSVHAGLTTCHDCHRVPLAHYPRNLVLTPLSSGDELDHRPHVESVLCGACHLEGAGDHSELTGPMTPRVLARVVKVDDSPLHRVHREATHRRPGRALGGADDPSAEPDDAEPHAANGPARDTIECMDCHGAESNRAHRFEASRDNCLACHEDISEATGRLAQLQCQECHFEGFVGSVAEAPTHARSESSGER